MAHDEAHALQYHLFPDAPNIEPTPIRRRDDLTFKGNRDRGRHGWLRLTPAYSVHLVESLVQPLGPADRVLDPFCGTGTTALVCAQAAVLCETTDINPFLVWLANAKCAVYAQADIAAAHETLAHALNEAVSAGEASGSDAEYAEPSRTRHPGEEANTDFWTPPIHDVGKWWAPDALRFLAHVFHHVRTAPVSYAARTLLSITFCRAAIEMASVSFGHQSMSFKKAPRQDPVPLFGANAAAHPFATFQAAANDILRSAGAPIHDGVARAVLGDARELSRAVPHGTYTTVITSPPYPNRMSYIRELRPYMYWLGYLRTGREAGELDWRAIGGTWGCATSNLLQWQPEHSHVIPFDGYEETIERISRNSRILGVYVAKYFHDTVEHVRSLRTVLAPGARVYYVIGNSKFYDVMLHTEQIYAAILRDHGFAEVTVRAIRKRTSKRELYEYIVSARA